MAREAGKKGGAAPHKIRGRQAKADEPDGSEPGEDPA
jgi:hypothetical protein